MKLLASLALTFFAGALGACISPGPPCSETNDCGTDDGSGTVIWDTSGPGHEIPPRPDLTNQTWSSCDVADTCVALGGTYELDILDKGWTIVPVVSGAVVVESQTPIEGGYHFVFRATNTGPAALSLRANFTDRAGDLHERRLDDMTFNVEEVSSVEIVSELVQNDGYTFESPLHALQSDALVVVALRRPTGGTHLLVDGSVHLGSATDPRIKRLDFAALEVGVDSGPRHIAVDGDSIAPAAFDVVVGGAADRVEANIVTPLVGSSGQGLVCFHAYWNDYEVERDSIDFAVTATNVTAESLYGIDQNCRAIYNKKPGAATISVSVDGVSTTLELP